MIVGNIKDVKENEIKSFPFKGKKWPVVGTTVKWLSQVGDTAMPEYGLRFFTIQPGGNLPVHQHEYAQTQIIMSGKLIAVQHNEDGSVAIEKELGLGEYFYVPPMEIHSMRNEGKEPATFFCCICVLDTKC